MHAVGATPPPTTTKPTAAALATEESYERAEEGESTVGFYWNHMTSKSIIVDNNCQLVVNQTATLCGNVRTHSTERPPTSWSVETSSSSPAATNQPTNHERAAHKLCGCCQKNDSKPTSNKNTKATTTQRRNHKQQTDLL